MSNETNPGTVIGRNMAAHSIQFGNGNRVFMKITADGELIVNDATEAAKALKAEWDKLFPERPAAHSQPAATVQEAIDFKYWLMDAARILRSNGTDTHASWVEKALAALTAEPAAKAGDARSISVAEEWAVYMDEAVSKAPEPLRQLGEYLAGLLDEDQWKTAERYLNAAALSPPASQSVEKIAYAIIKGSAGERAADHAREFVTANWEDAMRSARAVLALSTLSHKEEAAPATTTEQPEQSS